MLWVQGFSISFERCRTSSARSCTIYTFRLEKTSFYVSRNLMAIHQGRFKLDQEWERQQVFKQMAEDWRASKSRLVMKVRATKNEEERLQLRPDCIKSVHDWNDFVKEKTSQKFKGIGDLMTALLLGWSNVSLQVDCLKRRWIVHHFLLKMDIMIILLVLVLELD